jgi:hypothetical protein
LLEIGGRIGAVAQEPRFLCANWHLETRRSDRNAAYLTSCPIFRIPVTPLGALWASLLYAGEQTGGTFAGYISHKMPRTDGGIDDKVVVPE